MTMNDPKEQKLLELKKSGSQSQQNSSGGSNDFKVNEQPADLPPEPEQGEGGEQGAQTDPEAMALINEAVVETAAKTIGKVAALITKIPEMDFDEAEVEQLKRLWSPIMPGMSPMTAAIIGTSLIVAGKVAIYMAKNKGVKNAETEAAKQISTVPAKPAG